MLKCVLADVRHVPLHEPGTDPLPLVAGHHDHILDVERQADVPHDAAHADQLSLPMGAQDKQGIGQERNNTAQRAATLLFVQNRERGDRTVRLAAQRSGGRGRQNAPCAKVDRPCKEVAHLIGRLSVSATPRRMRIKPAAVRGNLVQLEDRWNGPSEMVLLCLRINSLVRLLLLSPIL